MILKKQLRKYLIMGSQNCERDPVSILEEAASAGITAFQFREKGTGSLTGQAKLELGERLRKVCTTHNILFIVNDDFELVESLDADGIHVGQDDMSVHTLRERFPDKVIGLSVSNQAEFDQSPIHLVDYIGVGAIYETTSKPDADAAIGMSWLRTLKQQHPELLMVGIGGINEHNAQDVIQAGADGVSVISAITQSENIQKTVMNL